MSLGDLDKFRQVSTGWNQRKGAKKFWTRQIKHNTHVLWLERRLVDSKLDRLKLLFLYFTTNIWKCWNKSYISPWISKQKCISPSICLKGATREVTYIIYYFYMDNNLICLNKHQTCSPHLISCREPEPARCSVTCHIVVK